MTANTTTTNAAATSFNFKAAAVEVKKIIATAAGFRTKATGAEKKAAVILIAAKAACEHGKYGKWLDDVGIARTTASRIVREFNNPEKKAERVAKNKKTPSAKNNKAMAADAGDDVRTEVLRIVGGLDADGIAAVYGFLAAQGFTADEDGEADDAMEA